MSTQNTTMPEKYRPDPWCDREVTATSDSKAPGSKSKPPVVVLRDWLGITERVALPIAPHDTRAVTIGFDEQPELGTLTVSLDGRYDSPRPYATLPRGVVTDYMDAEPGDIIRYARHTDRSFRAYAFDADAEGPHR